MGVPFVYSNVRGMQQRQNLKYLFWLHPCLVILNTIVRHTDVFDVNDTHHKTFGRFCIEHNGTSPVPLLQINIDLRSFDRSCQNRVHTVTFSPRGRLNEQRKDRPRSRPSRAETEIVIRQVKLG